MQNERHALLIMRRFAIIICMLRELGQPLEAMDLKHQDGDNTSSCESAVYEQFVCMGLAVV